MKRRMWCVPSSRHGDCRTVVRRAHAPHIDSVASGSEATGVLGVGQNKVRRCLSRGSARVHRNSDSEPQLLLHVTAPHHRVAKRCRCACTAPP